MKFTFTKETENRFRVETLGGEYVLITRDDYDTYWGIYNRYGFLINAVPYPGEGLRQAFDWLESRSEADHNQRRIEEMKVGETIDWWR